MVALDPGLGIVQPVEFIVKSQGSGVPGTDHRPPSKPSLLDRLGVILAHVRIDNLLRGDNLVHVVSNAIHPSQMLPRRVAPSERVRHDRQKMAPATSRLGGRRTYGLVVDTHLEEKLVVRIRLSFYEDSQLKLT